MEATPWTRWIRQALNGDADAAERAMPRIWSEIRARARLHMQREGPGHTLQPTALANECFLKLRQVDPEDIRNRQHFFRLVHRILRNILVNHAEEKGAKKRGGHLRREELTEDIAGRAEDRSDLLDLDQALRRLHEEYPGYYVIIRDHFFLNRSLLEIAGDLGCARGTVRNRYKAALMVLLRFLSG